MQLTKRESNKLDKLLEAAYKKHASGRQINIMKLNPLFQDAKNAHLAGATIDDAMIQAVETHCLPKEV